MSSNKPSIGMMNSSDPLSGTQYQIQCCGSFDATTDEYSFTAASGGLCVTFEFLKKEDVIEMRDCLDCMLASDLTEK